LNGTALANAALACYYPGMAKAKKKRPSDVNQLAHTVVLESTGEQLPTKAQISHLMAQLGKKGGKIGGKRRLETMTSAARKAIAVKAANARWAKKSS
jgi:hypothetical protein